MKMKSLKIVNLLFKFKLIKKMNSIDTQIIVLKKVNKPGSLAGIFLLSEKEIDNIPILLKNFDRNFKKVSNIITFDYKRLEIFQTINNKNIQNIWT